MGLIKRTDHLIIKSNLVSEIVQGIPVKENFQTNKFSSLSGIAKNDNDLYLLFADLINKIVFFINPLQNDTQNDYREQFCKNWSYFSKTKLLINENWKIGTFKFNTKNKQLTSSDIPILVCFENLQRNEKQCTLDLNMFYKIRTIVLRTFQHNSGKFLDPW